MNAHSFQTSPKGAAFLSLLLPGLGLFLRGYPKQSSVILFVSTLLGLGVWWVGYWGGSGSRVFFWMLFFLPWWIFQSFQSSLPRPEGISSTWKLVWERGYDIRYLGGLFLLAAVMDLYIIILNPDYHLHIFCTRPTGFLGTLVKLQSPIFHVLIGYGFLRLLRWGLLTYLVYAGYGLTNALINFACEGYGRIRLVFFITLLGFSLYILFRHHCFSRKFSS